MKNNVTYLFLLCLSSFASCGLLDRPPQQLLRANEMMQTAPDSSLMLLDDFAQSPDLEKPSTQAWYALLLTQARDKNYILHTSDSLIRIAVNYYDAKGDVALQAKSHYYWGRVYQDRKDDPRAVREFMTALSLAEEVDDDELTCILQCNLGYVFYQQEMYGQADSLYLRAEQIAVQQKDTTRLGTILSMLGKISIVRGEAFYFCAESKLNRALIIAENKKNIYLQRAVVYSLSSLYNRMEDVPKTLYYSKLGISLQEDTTEYYNYYLIEGMAYYRMAHYDSAVVCLTGSLFSKSYYTKAGAYMCLSDISRKRGNMQEALQMEDLYRIYSDSAEQSKCVSEVVASVKDALMQRTVRRYESFLHRYRHYIGALGIVLLSLVTVFIYKRRKYRAFSLQAKQMEERLRQKDAKLTNLQQEQLCRDALLTEKRKLCTEMEDRIVQMEISIKQLRQEESNGVEKDEVACLVEQMKSVTGEKERLFREILKTSSIYKRLLKLAEKNHANPDKMEKLSADDWTNLKADIDRISVDFTTRLNCKYELLTKDDLHFCCLVKTGLPFSKLASILCCTPNAVYKRRNTILGKMNRDLPERTIEEHIAEV